MSETDSPDPEFVLRLFRERVAAIIALAIVVGSFVMIGLALSFVSDAEQFSRAKDLLLFVNPILGVALGYFFNKFTSDARAETAELAAQSASASADQAFQSRDQALGEKETVRVENAEMKSAMQDLAGCVHEMMAHSAPAPALGTLGAESSTAAAQAEEAWKARLALELSLERAEQWLKQKG